MGGMRMPLIFLSAFFLLPEPATQADPVAKPAFKACIATDEDRPAPRKVMREAVRAVSEEFRRHAGIEIAASHFAALPPGRNAGAWVVGRALAEFCPKGADVFIVFHEWKKTVNEPGPDGAYLTREYAGEAETCFGVATVYGASERLKAKDAAGKPQLHGVLKHELGHLFGLDHEAGTESFMHESVAASKNGWTEDIASKLRRSPEPVDLKCRR